MPDFLGAAVKSWLARATGRCKKERDMTHAVADAALRGIVPPRIWPSTGRRPERTPPLWKDVGAPPQRAPDVGALRGQPSQLLDVWRPKELPQQPAPVLIFVPGGAWVHGSRMLQGYALMSHLAEQGWVCLSIDYRVAPNHRWPQHITDVKTAIAWARANVDKFGGDRNFVAVAGCSAGGHLAALAGLTPERPGDAGRPAGGLGHLGGRRRRHLRPLRLGGPVHRGARRFVDFLERVVVRRKMPGTRRSSGRRHRSPGCIPTRRRSWSSTARATPSSRSRRPAASSSDCVPRRTRW